MKFKNITSLILLSLFLLPSIAKLGHHHDPVLLKVNNEKHIPVYQDMCPICNFEFSVFLSNSDNIDLPKEKPLDNYFNNYYSLYNSNLSQFSFLLRAPPGGQI